MFNYALILTSNRDDSWDLVQETILKSLDNQDKYVENVNFKGWVLTIMRNIFINDYRKMINNRKMIDTTDELYYLSLPQDSGLESPDEAITVQEITKAINNLDKILQEPFSMHIAGYKYEEIAEKLAIPMGTVKNRIFLARKELQGTLKDFSTFK
jgi:RNA polymerase sigma-70 factor (ECF subfamily)